MAMFRRNGAKELVLDAGEEITSYGAQLVEDDKTRQRVLAGIAAALAARQRAKRQTGLVNLGARLAGDPVLRSQLAEMALQFRKAQRRVEKKRSHKLRNSIFLLAGFGAASAAVAVPAVRGRLQRLVRGGKDSVGTAFGGSSWPTTISEEIEVDVPVSTAYNQWTQFEQFPSFMEGVESVTQLDDTRLRWVATVAGRRAEWEAKILAQEPDRRIGWVSTDGKDTRGTVSFDAAGPSRARIRLEMTYTPDGAFEQAGSAAGLDKRRVRGDLDRFKKLIESQRVENGAWRGEIHAGAKTS